MIEVTIPLRSHEEAILVLGPYDRYAKLLRKSLDVDIFTRGGNLRLKGADSAVAEARRRVDHLLGKARKGRQLDARDIEAILVGPPSAGGDGAAAYGGTAGPHVVPQPDGLGESRAAHAALSDDRGSLGRSVGARAVEPRTANQRRYMEAIEKNSLTFGLGVAGTGKTFLAVAAAVRALRNGECRRLVITRPVVEAGERLGFLPGDMQAKLNPYLRPIYDALGQILRYEDVAQLEDAGVIEIAPLAYMRGRTLARSFVILDEGQNTSVGQMKMFLTRLGEGSRMVVTGDPSQSDLEDGSANGLADAARRLRGFEDVAVVEFDARDIVRHPLVEQIVRAYEGPARPARRAEAPAGPGPSRAAGQVRQRGPQARHEPESRGAS